MNELPKIVSLAIPAKNSSSFSCALCVQNLSSFSDFARDKNPNVSKDIEEFQKSLENEKPEYNATIDCELRPLKDYDEYVMPHYTYNIDKKNFIAVKNIHIKFFLAQEMQRGYTVTLAQITSIDSIETFKKKKTVDTPLPSSVLFDAVKIGTGIKVEPKLAFRVSAFRMTKDAKDEIDEFMRDSTFPEQIIKQIIGELVDI